MTEKLLAEANTLFAKKQRACGYCNDVRTMNIAYDERAIFLKCTSTGLEVPIPDDLKQPIFDMLYSYYKRTGDKLQREFDMLGKEEGICDE